MTPFKHAYIVLATDFELEPVIEQYLTTYPEAQPRQYDVVCKLPDERHQGDYAYIVVYEHVTPGHRPTLVEFIKAYCELHNKVAAVEKSGSTFPDLAKGNYGKAAKYRKT